MLSATMSDEYTENEYGDDGGGTWKVDVPERNWVLVDFIVHWTPLNRKLDFIAGIKNT